MKQIATIILILVMTFFAGCAKQVDAESPWENIKENIDRAEARADEVRGYVDAMKERVQSAKDRVGEAKANVENAKRAYQERINTLAELKAEMGVGGYPVPYSSDLPLSDKAKNAVARWIENEVRASGYVENAAVDYFIGNHIGLFLARDRLFASDAPAAD